MLRTNRGGACLAANWACLGILYNTGQDCTAGSRVYVQETVYDKFLEILVRKAKELVISDAFDEKAGGGPVVRPLFLFSLSCSVSFFPCSYSLQSRWRETFVHYVRVWASPLTRFTLILVLDTCGSDGTWLA